jgi:hypothetical protein
MTEYLQDQLRHALAVVDTCLESIYAGKAHMYRPLAGQLRLLLCDTQRKKDNSLFAAVYPKLEVSPLQAIVWSSSEAGGIEMRQMDGGTNRIAQMPLEITVFANGLSIANLLIDLDRFTPIREWIDQQLTFYPSRLDMRMVIRTVADKGGGAHVDANASPELRYMYKRAPGGRTFAELLVIAIGRYAQRLGEHLLGGEGSRLPRELLSAQHTKYNLLVAAPQDVAQLYSGRPGF